MIIGLSGKKQSGKDTVAKIIQYLIHDYNYPGVPITIERYLAGKKDYYESSYVGDLDYDIERRSGWQTKQFAGKLKQIVALLIGCTVEQLEDNQFKESSLTKEWNVKHLYRGNRVVLTMDEENLYPHIPLDPITPRKLLQLMGTDCGRDILHPNIWINALMADYTPQRIVASDSIEDISKNPYPNWIITDVRFPNEVKAIEDRGGIILRINRPGLKSTDNHESETALDNYNFDAILTNGGTIADLVDGVKTFLMISRLL